MTRKNNNNNDKVNKEKLEVIGSSRITQLIEERNVTMKTKNKFT